MRASFSGLILVRDKVVPLDFQCAYGCGDERGENGDRSFRVRFVEEGGRVEIAWPLILRLLGFIWVVGRRSESDGGRFS